MVVFVRCHPLPLGVYVFLRKSTDSKMETFTARRCLPPRDFTSQTPWSRPSPSMYRCANPFVTSSDFRAFRWGHGSQIPFWSRCTSRPLGINCLSPAMTTLHLYNRIEENVRPLRAKDVATVQLKCHCVVGHVEVHMHAV